MAIKTKSEIVMSMIDNIHTALPFVDTKVGTFTRDVFIDPTSNEVSDLYLQMFRLHMGQSVLSATGDQLDRLAQNYFITRKPATKAVGKLRFYVQDKNAYSVIRTGALVSTPASGGKPSYRYEVITESDTSKAIYDNATQRYYVEVIASSSFAGSAYNISSYQISNIDSTIDQNFNGVTNPEPFSGGTNQESDESLILRINLAFAGANIGTASGYLAFVLKQPDVSDGVIVGPGDPNMHRDAGKGGMVDIYVRSDRPAVDNYNFDVTSSYVTSSPGHEAYADLVLPKQPVTQIISVKSQIDSDVVNSKGFTIANIKNKYRVEDGSENLYTMIGESKQYLYDDDHMIKLERSSERLYYINTDTSSKVYPNYTYYADPDGKIYRVNSSTKTYPSHEDQNFFFDKTSKRLYYHNDRGQIKFWLIPGSVLYAKDSTGKFYYINEFGLNIYVRLEFGNTYELEVEDEVPNADGGVTQFGKIYFLDGAGIKNYAIPNNNTAIYWEDTLDNKKLFYLSSSNQKVYITFENNQLYLDTIANKIYYKNASNVKIFIEPTFIDLIYEDNTNRIFYFDENTREKIYIQPDLLLIKDKTSDNGSSLKGKDSLRWLFYGRKPQLGEKLIITYSYNSSIEDLQSQLDQVRVITADVLIKEAKSIGIKIYVTVYIYKNFDQEETKKKIIDRVSQFINDAKKMGNVLDKSDIVYVIRGTLGVDQVDLNSLILVEVRHENDTIIETPAQTIEANSFEYLNLSDIQVTTLQSPRNL